MFLLKELFCGPSLHSTSPLALSAGLLTRCFETKSYSRTRRRRPCCHPPPCLRRRCSNNNSSSRSTSTWTDRTNFTPRPRATLRRPTIPIRINFLDFIFIFNLIQIIGERLRGHWGTRSFDRITFFRNSFFSFEFRSFEKEVRVGQVRLGDLGIVRGWKNGLRGGYVRSV